MERKIAQNRVDILFDLAEKEAMRRNWNRASRYVTLARKIGMKYNVPPKSIHRRRYCRNCRTFLLPSVTLRVRVARGRVIYTCTKCGKILRFPYVREKQEQKTIS